MRSRSIGRFLALTLALLVLTATPPAGAQPSSPPPPAGAQPPAQPPTPPFAPAWGMIAGWDVFNRKGCGSCHAMRGFGPTTGPDLGRIASGTSFFDIGAAMWNHVPRMNEWMRAERRERPRLTPREAAELVAFLFTAQYHDELGDARAGERVFTAKGCRQCHALGGSGGSDGPPLDVMKAANSPVLVAAAMWNHGPQMAEAMKARGIPRPTFQGREMIDLIAYVVATARDTGAETMQVVPGTPARGETLFTERRCATCHAVGGKGGKVGPDLGRSGQHVSLTRFAGRMWNHGPAMWAKLRERGLQPPPLSGQDMADLLAYLYTAHYFEPRGRAGTGQRLVRERGCLGCHSVRGKGGKDAGDFATSRVVGSAPAIVAALWNHGPGMEAKAEKKGAAWPALKGAELADIAAYLTSLSAPATSKPK